MTDRQKLEAAILAALLLIYRGSAAAALERLHAPPHELTKGQRTKIERFAATRARKVMTGSNERLAGAASDDDPAAVPAAAQSIRTHHDDTLIPFLVSWAGHQGLIDAYAETESAGGGSALDAVDWNWTQNTDYRDDCTDAAEASPASYDDLIAITGDPPPVHNNCLCTLEPAG